jgi:CheY-like chemotaxis protein
MADRVLVVDDDRILLRRIEKSAERYGDYFSLHLAENGREAVDVLRSGRISLVVTDLQMPKMDGFELLAFMSENYPDIPVIIMTAYGSKTSRRAVLLKGAVGFIDKPVVPDDLARKICATLEETAEGGRVQTVPLSLFGQLVAMEQLTCTLRVTKPGRKPQGALFFRKGELLNARLDDLHGEAAARKIFSWMDATYTIQYSCTAEEKNIPGGLQGILSTL